MAEKDAPSLKAPAPSEAPKANPSKEPPAKATGTGSFNATSGSGGMAGPSEGTPPSSIFPDHTEPGRATSLAAGVGSSVGPTEVPGAVPANSTATPAVQLAENPDLVGYSQAGVLADTGKHPFQMSESERAKLPIITNRDGEDAVAERILKGGSNTEWEEDNASPTGSYVRVAGVVGTFGNVIFGNDNISTKRVQGKDLEDVQRHFPNAKVETLDEHPKYQGITDAAKKRMKAGGITPDELRFTSSVHAAHLASNPNTASGGSTGPAASGSISTKSGKIPEDFPAYTELEEAGEATYAKINKRIQDGKLKEIDGIGDVKEAQILEAMK